MSLLHKLIQLSHEERLVVYFTAALIIGLGIFAYTQLPIEAYPDLTNTRVQIISQWPGKSAEEMLALLAERLNNDPAEELRIAAAEQEKIMLLRLQKLAPTGAGR